MTLIDKAEALATLRKHANGKTVLGGQVYQSLTLETALEAINALPARGVGVKPDRTVGDFACAAIDFIETMQAHGFTTAAGQSDDDDLDFCIAVYRESKIIGCASFHYDRSWSCYLEVGDKTFRCESTPWFKLPDGLEDAIAALAPTDAARARVIRNGEHLFNTAKSLGWADDGEGALEFVMRRTREVALEDAAQAREAAQLDFVTLLTDAAAVAMKAREEALRDAAEVADEHTFGGPAVRDAILALIGEKPREQRE